MTNSGRVDRSRIYVRCSVVATRVASASAASATATGSTGPEPVTVTAIVSVTYAVSPCSVTSRPSCSSSGRTRRPMVTWIAFAMSQVTVNE